MTAKSDELVNELVSAAIAFGREKEPDWQTRIETALCALKAHVEELEAAQRWIPVSERLPEPYEKVIALAKDCMNVDWVLPKELCQVGKGAFARLYNVTHWMPLPQPPEVQK